MTRKQPATQVPAELIVENGEWVATTTSPKLRVTGLSRKAAITNLEGVLTTTLSRPVTVVEKVRLPKPLADDVSAYLRDFEQEAALQKKREASVTALAKRLVIDGKMSQREVAILLRLSPTWLSQLFKKDGIGESRTGEHTRR